MGEWCPVYCLCNVLDSHAQRCDGNNVPHARNISFYFWMYLYERSARARAAWWRNDNLLLYSIRDRTSEPPHAFRVRVKQKRDSIRHQNIVQYSVREGKNKKCSGFSIRGRMKVNYWTRGLDCCCQFRLSRDQLFFLFAKKKKRMLNKFTQWLSTTSVELSANLKKRLSFARSFIYFVLSYSSYFASSSDPSNQLKVGQILFIRVSRGKDVKYNWTSSSQTQYTWPRLTSGLRIEIYKDYRANLCYAYWCMGCVGPIINDL